jgi:hypothetical protein
MSENIQIAIITSLSTAIPLMLVHYLNYRSLKDHVGQIGADVKIVEIATNSMKDALVKAAHAAGGSEEREKQRTQAETLKAVVSEQAKNIS